MGQLSVVRALVDAGAKVNHESLTMATPLSRAIESSSLDVVHYLLAKRADARHENLARTCTRHILSTRRLGYYCLCVERNLLDLASDFASPQVFNVVRAAYEGKAHRKGQPASRPRRKAPLTMKPKKVDETVRPEDLLMDGNVSVASRTL